MSPILAQVKGICGRSEAQELKDKVDALLKHRFDLFGSGKSREWNLIGRAPRVPRACRRHAARISSLLEPGYRRIDWCSDPASGFSWPLQTWYKWIRRLKTPPGADIKVPWQLGRLHFLLEGAVAAVALSGDGWVDRSHSSAREFRNVILDFMAANPPRWGVQWASPMDVAIRVVNVLVAWDVLATAGATFEPHFERILTDLVYDHGRHIFENLEDGPTFTGNHFLANLVGLAFVGAYLPSSRASDAWLRFAYENLQEQVRHQFQEDGGCFEGSTSYHRLSTELVLAATAVILGLPAHDERLRTPPQERFPSWYSERLWRAIQFSQAIQKPSGCVPQIGDNDSGRLLTAVDGCCGEPLSRPLLVLDHRHLQCAGAGIFNVAQSLHSGGWHDLLECFAKAVRLPRPSGDPHLNVTIGRREALETAQARFDHASESRRRQYEFAVAPEALVGMTTKAFPLFGVYVFSSRGLYIAIRCGPVGQGGRGGHSHNDQLCLELTIDGVDVIRDPGSYLYTADPAARNRYRSVIAHFAPRLDGKEPAGLDGGLFLLERAKAGCVQYFGRCGFVGSHNGYGVPVFRAVEVLAGRVRIRDVVEEGADGRFVDLTSYIESPPVAYSPAYGLTEA